MPDFEILREPDDHLAKIEASRAVFLGPEGSYSDLAAHTLFKDSEHIPHYNFAMIMRAVLDDPDAVAVVPIRNEVSGEVYAVLGELRTGAFQILGEAPFMVHLDLAGKGQRADRITTVYSHPQPLKQASHFLATQLPNLEELHEVESTAEAAHIVQLKRRGVYGAICSPQAARKNRLNVIKTDIQDRKDNSTRFLIVRAFDEGNSP